MFTIETMKHILGPGLEEEALLCPVRVLRWYLDKTKDLPEMKKNTTIHFL